MAKSRSGASSMRRSSGAGVAYARMMRSTNLPTAVVYVEGESDISFYRWMINNSTVTLQHMDGKPAAMQAVLVANEKKVKGTIAIVDSDFDNILKIGPDKNVIRTDTHDIETLMLKEIGFRTAVSVYEDQKILEKYGYGYEDIKTEILKIGCSIGKLRLISIENNLNLNFKSVEEKLNREELITFEDGKVVFDLRSYIYECVNSTYKCPISFKDLYELYENDTREFDTWQICRGHDLTLLISLFYSRTLFGKHNVYRREIENVIRNGYIFSRKIKKTNMYKDIISWQKENLGWKILSNELL